MKNQVYHTVRTFPKSNIRIVERGKIDTSNTQFHDHSISWLGTGTSMKSGRVKIVLWAQTQLIHWRNLSKFQRLRKKANMK